MKDTSNRRRGSSGRSSHYRGANSMKGLASTRLTEREIEAARLAKQGTFNPKFPNAICPECGVRVNVTNHGQIKSHRIGGGTANIRRGDIKCLGHEMYVSLKDITEGQEE